VSKPSMGFIPSFGQGCSFLIHTTWMSVHFCLYWDFFLPRGNSATMDRRAKYWLL